MNVDSSIRYVHREELDIRKWDHCIESAPNGLIYARSFYLDTMSPNWDALVLNDYDAVMPLPWRKKFCISYLYQPFLTAQLGIFGKKTDAALTKKFIAAIPKKFKLIEISLNSSNSFGNQLRKNYVLQLNRNYEELSASYSENIHRNLRKSLQAGCSVSNDCNIETVITLAIAQMKSQGHEPGPNIDSFRQLYSLLSKKGMTRIYGIHTSAGKLMSSAVFFCSDNRAYYILVGNHPESKQLGTSHALIDEFIKDHAGKEMILDFEGSDIPSLALFYSSFGAKEELYPWVKLKRL